jgi:hypothetical protein
MTTMPDNLPTCGPSEPEMTAPRPIDPRIRQLMWEQLPERGIMATEMRCLRRFLEAKGLWAEYLTWTMERSADVECRRVSTHPAPYPDRCLPDVHTPHGAYDADAGPVPL